MGVTWIPGPPAENVTIVEHGGTWKGSALGSSPPRRNFAMTVLANSRWRDSDQRPFRIRLGIAGIRRAQQSSSHATNALVPSTWRPTRAGTSPNKSPKMATSRRSSTSGQGRPACWERGTDANGWPKQRQSRASPAIGPTWAADPTTSPPAVSPASCAGRTATSPGSVASTAVCSDANSTAPAGGLRREEEPGNRSDAR